MIVPPTKLIRQTEVEVNHKVVSCDHGQKHADKWQVLHNLGCAFRRFVPVKHLQEVGNSNQFPKNDDHSHPKNAPRNLEMRVVVTVAPDFGESNEGQNE